MISSHLDEEELDLFAKDEPVQSSDHELENVRLNLSQLDPRACKKPRVHWVQSPLSKNATTENEDKAVKVIETYPQVVMQEVIEPKNKEENEIRVALTGLLRSKSRNSSPMSATRTPKRPYMSPLTKESRFVASTAPSSDGPTETLVRTPLRPKSISPNKMLDIEDLGDALSSSFFSDTEVHLATQAHKIDATLVLEDFDDFDFLEPITESLPPLRKDPTPIQIHTRFLVYTIEKDQIGTKLTGTNMDSKCMQSFHVKGDWLRCLPKEPPFIVHTVFESCLVIDDEAGFLVAYPDTLISATLIADSLSCSRRAVLSARTQASVEDNKPSVSLISGSIVHDIVEKAMLEGRYDADFLGRLVPGAVRKSLIDIFCAEQEEATLIHQVQGLLDRFPTWAEDHLVNPPTTQDCFIQQVIRVEENIWSHAFGLKGKIDSTVLFQDRAQGWTFLVPFEMKTGHGTTSISHRAQAILYSFMIWDRYHVRTPESLLFYVGKGELFRLKPSRADLKSLLMARNMLAVQLNNISALPPKISNQHVCSKCFQLESCTLYHKVVENGTSMNSPSPQYFDQRTSHLGPNTERLTNFFNRWNRLVQLEEGEAINARNQLWTQTTEERKKHGMCMDNLILVECTPTAEEEATTFAGFICKFKPLASALMDQTAQFNERDPIVISASDQKIFGLAIGYFLGAHQDGTFSAVVDRPIIDQSETLSTQLNFPIKPINLFRIDKDELTSGFGLLRTNLLKLAAPESMKLMKLVVNLEVPIFDSLPSPIPSELQASYEELDQCQKEAVRRVLETRDYLLILGMPGTGKSTTLVFIIRLLIHLGKTILLSSHTHTAIDNILLKLLQASPETRFVRLGNSSKIPKALHAHVLETQKFASMAQLEAFYMNPRLVACTCLGANQSILQKRRFDICIMDEASQISVPASLGPLRLASSFVLVGDHYQLPPLVRSKVAMSEGLNQSLFALLANAHPEAVTMLRLQYRMNTDIMAISNHLVYGGMLKCANDTVGQARLVLPLSFKLCCSQGCSQCWLQAALEPERTVMFLDTDSCGALETPSGKSYFNQYEAKLIKAIVGGLMDSGLDPNEISVISPYRPQLKLLTDDPEYPTDVRTSTVDRFQGLDSDCILISLVRSNTDSNIGQLLKDWNRLNVAFTRAKKKLIIIGSARTIMQQEVFERLWTLFKQHDWICRLPADALYHHLKRIE